MYAQYKTSYERETQILKDLNKNKNMIGFLKFLDCGFDPESNSYYIVTELLGTDIHKLMMRSEGKKFRPETAVKIGLQMFNRIADMHKQGYVHRDVKLNNFVCGAPDNYCNSDAMLNKDQQKKLRASKNPLPSDDAALAKDEPVEDDGSIVIIDYGISKKIDKLSGPEQ